MSPGAHGAMSSARFPRCCFRGRRVARHVDERPALPLVDPHGCQPVLGHLEPRSQSQQRSRFQRPVLLVRPAVIRALDERAFGGSTNRQQLVAAMPADIEEAAQRSGVVTRQQDRLRADAKRPPAAWPHQAFGAAQADPGRLEEVAHLPRKQLGRRIRLAGQRVAVPEFGERTLQQPSVDRRGSRVHELATVALDPPRFNFRSLRICFTAR